MVHFAYKLKDLSFSKLMEVYTEGNQENGREFWPYETPAYQLAMAEQDFYDYLSQTFFAIPGAYYAVLEEGGRYVSALRMEPYQDGLLLSALETNPGFRRSGYGKQIIQEVLAHIGEGKVYSHVSKKNIASLRTHESCGFHKILDHAVYADGSVLTNSVTLMREMIK